MCRCIKIILQPDHGIHGIRSILLQNEDKLLGKILIVILIEFSIRYPITKCIEHKLFSQLILADILHQVDL